jgi:hypothetical protein
MLALDSLSRLTDKLSGQQEARSAECWSAGVPWLGIMVLIGQYHSAVPRPQFQKHVADYALHSSNRRSTRDDFRKLHVFGLKPADRDLTSPRIRSRYIAPQALSLVQISAPEVIRSSNVLANRLRCETALRGSVFASEIEPIVKVHQYSFDESPLDLPQLAPQEGLDRNAVILRTPVGLLDVLKL